MAPVRNRASIESGGLIPIAKNLLTRQLVFVVDDFGREPCREELRATGIFQTADEIPISGFEWNSIYSSNHLDFRKR